MDSVHFYKDLRRKPDASHEYLQFITDQLVKFANLIVDAGADIISILDPTATGELLGPKSFVEYAILYINQVVDSVSDRALTIVHICGRMQAVLEEFNEVRDDVRQVQLAKGAILSGFISLVNAAGISLDELDLVYVAGQFGSYLPKESLVGTGILPSAVEDKIEYLGNSSKQELIWPL